MTSSTALVTGPSGGIGLQIARQLAERGWTVLVGARDAARGAEAAGSFGSGARMRLLRSTSTHILASVCHSSIGSSSIPQRAADVPIGPANAKRRGASTAVTSWAR